MKRCGAVSFESPGRSSCESEIEAHRAAFPFIPPRAPATTSVVGETRTSGARQARIRCRGAAGRWPKHTGHLLDLSIMTARAFERGRRPAFRGRQR